MTQKDWLNLKVGTLIKSSAMRMTPTPGGMKLDWGGDCYGLVTRIEVSFLTKEIDWMEVRWECNTSCGGEMWDGGVMRHTFWNFVDKPVEVIGEAAGAVNG